MLVYILLKIWKFLTKLQMGVGQYNNKRIRNLDIKL